jgi:hypothetical protein
MSFANTQSSGSSQKLSRNATHVANGQELGTKLKSSDPEFWHKNEIRALLNSLCKSKIRALILLFKVRSHLVLEGF